MPPCGQARTWRVRCLPNAMPPVTTQARKNQSLRAYAPVRRIDGGLTLLTDPFPFVNRSVQNLRPFETSRRLN
jgi:hypothetical protein